MQERERGLFPTQEQKREIPDAEIANAAAVVRDLAAQTMRGEKKAVPSELYEAIQALVPQPAIEVVVTRIVNGKEQYALLRRSPTDEQFGPNRLHIPGGFLKPNRHGVSMVDAGREMIQKEMGVANAEYIAGPIATYQWTRTIDHPTGWPSSQVYVLKISGDVPTRDDIVWFDADTLPATDEVITGRPGEIHMNFLRVYQEWRKNPQQPCRDLNEQPLPQVGV